MTSKHFLLTLIILVLLVAGGAVYYMFSHDAFDRASGAATDNNQELSDADVAKLVKAVGKHMLLPEGEAPVTAKIVDVDELLKTQPFYRGAINGDLLLIYQVAAKAILYSPSRDILVNVGPIILDEEATGTPTTTTAPIEADVSEEEEVEAGNTE